MYGYFREKLHVNLFWELKECYRCYGDKLYVNDIWELRQRFLGSQGGLRIRILIQS